MGLKSHEKMPAKIWTVGHVDQQDKGLAIVRNCPFIHIEIGTWCSIEIVNSLQ